MWREYHEATKHSVESLRRARRGLDWANMPAPFRHYEGVPLLDLPADAPAPQAAALDVLHGAAGVATARDGAEFLSQVLFHSAAVSATKVVADAGYRYALRVNPSSGNLHPTEFHFATRGLRGWPDGLYHYRASAHMAEQRARGDVGLSDAPLVFLLTSIAWREAWKYGERAYRYCLHDAGHAWEALALAAQACGCECHARGQFDDEDAARRCGLPEDEWPMLLVEVRGPGVPLRGGESEWLGGEANVLSRETIAHPGIEAMQAAARVMGGGGAARVGRDFAAVVRGRRSALDFVGGDRNMTRAQLATLIEAAQQPLSADFDSGHVELFVYAHRVEDVAAGVYRVRRGELDLVRSGDQRAAAAGLSLGQDLAGNACVAFSMIGALERACGRYGDRGYRYAHFEAGVIGQRLYVAAEALGLRATGIGAFFDDRVNRYLELSPERGQVVYHFAVGYPVADPRLDAVPAAAADAGSAAFKGETSG